MPTPVSVKYSEQRGKVPQLKRHRQGGKHDEHSWRARLTRSRTVVRVVGRIGAWKGESEGGQGEGRVAHSERKTPEQPQSVVYKPQHHIEQGVVPVRKRAQRERRQIRKVAQHNPSDERTHGQEETGGRNRRENVKDAQEGIEQGEGDCQGRTEIVKTFRPRGVSPMKDGRPDPCVHLDDAERDQPRPQSVGRMDAVPGRLDGSEVYIEIAKRHEDGEGFLKRPETVKSPFAVDWLRQ
nr:hypothetical protein L203_06583 [Cryptococcus depauperatus CBS 7841]